MTQGPSKLWDASLITIIYFKYKTPTNYFCILHKSDHEYIKSVALKVERQQNQPESELVVLVWLPGVAEDDCSFMLPPLKR